MLRRHRLEVGRAGVLVVAEGAVLHRSLVHPPDAQAAPEADALGSAVPLDRQAEALVARRRHHGAAGHAEAVQPAIDVQLRPLVVGRQEVELHPPEVGQRAPFHEVDEHHAALVEGRVVLLADVRLPSARAPVGVDRDVTVREPVGDRVAEVGPRRGGRGHLRGGAGGVEQGDGDDGTKVHSVSPGLG